MKTKLLKEVAKLQANLAKNGADHRYVEAQLAVAPLVQKKIEQIMPNVERILAKSGVELTDYNFEWTDAGFFTIHVGGRALDAWTSADFRAGTKPGSKLDALLYKLGKITHVAHVEEAIFEIGEDMYLLITG